MLTKTHDSGQHQEVYQEHDKVNKNRALKSQNRLSEEQGAVEMQAPKN